MKWFLRHPFLLWLMLAAAGLFASYRLHLQAVSFQDPEMAGWSQMSFLVVIFGTLCIRFPHILGSMEGPVGRGGLLRPTPHGLVKGMGWGMMILPVIVFLLVVFFGKGA